MADNTVNRKSWDDVTTTPVNDALSVLDPKYVERHEKQIEQTLLRSNAKRRTELLAKLDDNSVTLTDIRNEFVTTDAIANSNTRVGKLNAAGYSTASRIEYLQIALDKRIGEALLAASAKIPQQLQEIDNQRRTNIQRVSDAQGNIRRLTQEITLREADERQLGVVINAIENPGDHPDYMQLMYDKRWGKYYAQGFFRVNGMTKDDEEWRQDALRLQAILAREIESRRQERQRLRNSIVTIQKEQDSLRRQWEGWQGNEDLLKRLSPNLQTKIDNLDQLQTELVAREQAAEKIADYREANKLHADRLKYAHYNEAQGYWEWEAGSFYGWKDLPEGQLDQNDVAVKIDDDDVVQPLEAARLQEIQDAWDAEQQRLQDIDTYRQAHKLDKGRLRYAFLGNDSKWRWTKDSMEGWVDMPDAHNGDLVNNECLVSDTEVVNTLNQISNSMKANRTEENHLKHAYFDHQNVVWMWEANKFLGWIDYPDLAIWNNASPVAVSDPDDIDALNERERQRIEALDPENYSARQLWRANREMETDGEIQTLEGGKLKEVVRLLIQESTDNLDTTLAADIEARLASAGIINVLDGDTIPNPRIALLIGYDHEPLLENPTNDPTIAAQNAAKRQQNIDNYEARLAELLASISGGSDRLTRGDQDLPPAELQTHLLGAPRQSSAVNAILHDVAQWDADMPQLAALSQMERLDELVVAISTSGGRGDLNRAEPSDWRLGLHKRMYLYAEMVCKRWQIEMDELLYFIEFLQRSVPRHAGYQLTVGPNGLQKVDTTPAAIDVDSTLAEINADLQILSTYEMRVRQYLASRNDTLPYANRAEFWSLLRLVCEQYQQFDQPTYTPNTPQLAAAFQIYQALAAIIDSEGGNKVAILKSIYSALLIIAEADPQKKIVKVDKTKVKTTETKLQSDLDGARNNYAELLNRSLRWRNMVPNKQKATKDKLQAARKVLINKRRAATEKALELNPPASLTELRENVVNSFMQEKLAEINTQLAVVERDGKLGTFNKILAWTRNHSLAIMIAGLAVVLGAAALYSLPLLSTAGLLASLGYTGSFTFGGLLAPATVAQLGALSAPIGTLGAGIMALGRFAGASKLGYKLREMFGRTRELDADKVKELSEKGGPLKIQEYIAANVDDAVLRQEMFVQPHQVDVGEALPGFSIDAFGQRVDDKKVQAWLEGMMPQEVLLSNQELDNETYKPQFQQMTPSQAITGGLDATGTTAKVHAAKRGWHNFKERVKHKASQTATLRHYMGQKSHLPDNLQLLLLQRRVEWEKEVDQMIDQLVKQGYTGKVLQAKLMDKLFAHYDQNLDVEAQGLVTRDLLVGEQSAGSRLKQDLGINAVALFAATGGPISTFIGPFEKPVGMLADYVSDSLGAWWDSWSFSFDWPDLNPFDNAADAAVAAEEVKKVQFAAEGAKRVAEGMGSGGIIDSTDVVGGVKQTGAEIVRDSGINGPAEVAAATVEIPTNYFDQYRFVIPGDGVTGMANHIGDKDPGFLQCLNYAMEQNGLHERFTYQDLVRSGFKSAFENHPENAGDFINNARLQGINGMKESVGYAFNEDMLRKLAARKFGDADRWVDIVQSLAKADFMQPVK